MAKRAEDRFGSVAEMRQVFQRQLKVGAAVQDDSDLSELDEFITTAPPMRISVPLSPPERGSSPQVD
jgi:hypothetical protein